MHVSPSSSSEDQTLAFLLSAWSRRYWGATSPTTLQCTQPKVDQPKSLLWWAKPLKTKFRSENKQRVASLRQSGSRAIFGWPPVGRSASWKRKKKLRRRLFGAAIKTTGSRQNITSPRMPHTLGEIFAHAQSLDFKNRNSWAGPGAASVLVDQHVRSCRPETWSVAVGPRPISAASAVANCGWNYCWWSSAGGATGKEDLKADRRVRHYKEVGLQEWPLAGRATIPRVLYGFSLCMSLRRRTILSKSLRAPRSRRPHHSHFSHGRQNRRPSFCRCRTVREEVRIWWQSRGLQSLCLPICTTTFML